MELDLETLSPPDAYRWMISMIIPRPIAWVSTLSLDGRSNLAPFSFFTGVCAHPPTLVFCPANDRTGRKKDTLMNVESTREFVVNFVSCVLAERMNATSASLPYGESEFAKCGVEPVASTKVKPPRVAGSPVAFECRLDQVVRIGEGPLAGNAVFGRIIHLHVEDDVLGPNGLPDPQKLDPLARLGGENYTRLGPLLSLARPA
jgi:flavin reductase (DIM6/NTAB) family NADH-FMN oxidoreductase RutF